MNPFRSASYQSQVSRLRALASEALKLYDIKVSELELINHGENTTFKAIDSHGRPHLLRVHRADYHTPAAIHEELAWLDHLTDTDIEAPSPIRSHAGRFLELVESRGVDGVRPVDLMRWVDGRFVWKNVRPLHMRKIGRLLAQLQIDAARRRVKHRRYWTPEGLVGRDAKLGSVYHLKTATKKEQAQITGAARDLLREFQRYEKAAPKKMGLIHADLHFGNMVFRSDGQPAPIDFDDCGFGFHMYDLAVVLLNIHYLASEEKTELDYLAYREALLDGYRELKELDSRDEEMLRLFMIARRVMMVGWLEQRSDNPRLAKRVRESLDRALKVIAARGAF